MCPVVFLRDSQVITNPGFVFVDISNQSSDNSSYCTLEPLEYVKENLIITDVSDLKKCHT